MPDTNQLMYDKAHTLRLHQDNLRWTIIGGYFALMGGVLALLEKGNFCSEQHCVVGWFAFVANNLVLLIFAVENWYYNLFTKFVHHCEDSLLHNLQPKTLEQFRDENAACVSVFHYSYAFIYFIVILTNTFFAYQYLQWKPLGLLAYITVCFLLLLFWRHTIYKCFLCPLKCISDWAVGSKRNKRKATEHNISADGGENMRLISAEKIKKEANDEFKKSLPHLAQDIIREANTLPSEPAGEKENLDIIKHLLKRIALHQLVMDKQNRRTICILILLSIIMVVGALFTVLQYYKN